MWKAALAGVVLATTGATVGLAQTNGMASHEQSQTARGPAVGEGHIARLRAALKLTPEQQRHWPAVASALRGLSRAGNAVATANAVRRIASAARPLIASLTSEQRQAGMQVIRASGFSHLASAL